MRQPHDDFLFLSPSSSAILASSSELTVSKAFLNYGRRYSSCSKVGLDSHHIYEETYENMLVLSISLRWM